MSRSLTFCVLVLIATASVNADDDLRELRQLSEAARSEGLQPLVGLTCHGVAEALAANGHSIWRHQVRASFRSADRWIVFIGPSPEVWEGAVVRNGRLVYHVNLRNPEAATMPEHGFGAARREYRTYVPNTFFPSATSGRYLEDISFADIAKQPEFTATRMPSEDSAEFGRCWSWSAGTTPIVLPFVGKVWFRTFENGATVIAKLEYGLEGGRINRVVNEFSKDPAHPSLIENVVTQEGQSTRTFTMIKVEAENEPQNGYAPERFGLKSPTDPLTIRLWLVFGAIALVGMAVYVIRRHRQNG